SSSSSSSTEKPNEMPITPDSDTNGEATEASTVPKTLTKSIIETIRCHHRTLCIMRRTAELQLRGVHMNPFEAELEEYEIVPCTYQIMNEATRIMITGLFEFAPLVFPEFKDLPTTDKWLLIRNYQKSFHFLDAHMRQQRRCEPGTTWFFGSYTTSMSADLVDIYFSDCPDQQNVTEAASTLRQCIQENHSKLQKHLKHLLVTEDEFLVLMGISFWSVENVEHSDTLLALASRYRSELLSELSAKYKETIGVEQGTIRIGQLFCMMQTFKKCEMNMKWEYEVYRMLNVFDENTFMYSMQLHRADIESSSGSLQKSLDVGRHCR
ncbi:hypothetical protein PENTCL1PPCAC_14538, partial [Pristionchus entomophagus]